MRPARTVFIAFAMIFAVAAAAAHAEVKTVQMKIAGYLCGN